MDAITTRKTKKDYYDLYFLLNKFTLEEMIRAYKEKFPYNSSKNVIVGLSACSVADSDEQPELLNPVSWNEVKARLINEVFQYEKNIIVQKESEIKKREQDITQLLQEKRGKKI